MTDTAEVTGGFEDEPPMYMQRPSSARSQDVTHILVRTFRELFTRDTIAPDVVQYLNTSRYSDDEYHQKYVDALVKVQTEHNERLAEFNMLERHIMEAQARAVSADERQAHILYADVKETYPDVHVPPVDNHFRSCINSELLKEHNLISPHDFSKPRASTVAPPAAPQVPHYARVNTLRSKPKTRPHVKSIPSKRAQSASASSPSCLHRQRSLPRLDVLWKQQMSANDRAMLKEDLASLQKRVDYLKNVHFIAPTSACNPSARRTLIGPDQSTNRKPRVVDVGENTQIFVATPSTIQFSDYQPGLVYEMSVELMNISSVMRPVRVIPPQTPYFSVSLGQFPSFTSQIAPGLACVYHIRFSPDSVCDFDDVLVVESLTSSPLRVPLCARRQPPVLTLPECLNVGHCLVGGVKIGRFVVKNKGGYGRFCLIPTDDWPHASFKSFSAMSFLRFGEIFEVKPVLFEMMPDHCTNLDVVFTPKSHGEFFQQLTILCDNCHVQHVTITGTGVTPRIELAADSLLSAPVVGEPRDRYAQHFLRFPILNPFTCTHRIITVKNCVDVELPFYWIFVKPDLRAVDPTEDLDVSAVFERVQDVDTMFSIDPEAGLLPPGKTVSFMLAFAPTWAAVFHNALHMVLRYLQVPTTASSEGNEHWISRSQASSVLDPILKEETVLEIDLKGPCVPYSIALEPSALLIPGQILPDTVAKKKFKMSNNSLSAVCFSWSNVASWYILHVEPTIGDLPAQSEMVFELSVSATRPGLIDETLICRFDCIADDVVSLIVKATVKSLELIVEQLDLDFGVVCVGDLRTLSLTVRNAERSPVEWSVAESRDHVVDEDAESEFHFNPSSGTLKQLSVMSIEVTFQPRACRAVRSALQLLVVNGSAVVVSVLADVQVPRVCLLRSSVNFEAYVGVPSTQTVTLYNQTVFETDFCWGSACGSVADSIVVDVEPQSGLLGPREQVDVTVTLVACQAGKIADVFVPCVVDGMVERICLSLEANVSGLSVSYSVRETPSGADTWLIGEGVVMDFGCDSVVGGTPNRYLRIQNNSLVAAPFCVSLQNFQSPLSGNDQIELPGELPRLLLNSTIVDSSAKAPSKVFSELCRQMLQSGLGLAFDATPLSGVLPPLGEVLVKITAYSDMWGTYADQLRCCVGDFDPVDLPVTITVVGSPLHFQMVSHNRCLLPILRFGEAVDGQNVVERRARILNTSSFDLRLDLQVFNTQKDDRQLVDFMTIFGEPFPVKDPDLGSEFASSSMSEEELGRLAESQPKVVRVKLREHGGLQSKEPFTVEPSQFVIAAHSSASVNVRFNPQLPGCIHAPVEYVAYALGYATLDSSALTVEDKLCRQHQYESDPLRLEITATIAPAVLDIECDDDDECLAFYAAASDLLMDSTTANEQQLKPVHLVLRRVTLSNTHASEISFSMSCPCPFDVVQAVTDNSPSSRLNQTSKLVLKPRQSAVVNVSFTVSPELLRSTAAPVVSPGDGMHVERTEMETRVRFCGALHIKHGNRSVQSVPLDAVFVLPCLRLSTYSADFGTCFISQTRVIEVLLSNTSRSGTVWKCCIDSRSENCSEYTFIVSPCAGQLEGQLSFRSANKIHLRVSFAPQAAQLYEAVCSLEDVLMQEKKEILLRGEGTFDGHFEALVNA